MADLLGIREAVAEYLSRMDFLHMVHWAHSTGALKRSSRSLPWHGHVHLATFQRGFVAHNMTHAGHLELA